MLLSATVYHKLKSSPSPTFKNETSQVPQTLLSQGPVIYPVIVLFTTFAVIECDLNNSTCKDYIKKVKILKLERG